MNWIFRTDGRVSADNLTPRTILPEILQALSGVDGYKIRIWSHDGSVYEWEEKE